MIIQPTPELPVPIITTVRHSHGRLVEGQTLIRTWCGRTFTAPTEAFTLPMPGIADTVAAVSCKDCRRSRPASWDWKI